MNRNNLQGMTLIELMIAMAIGLFILLAISSVYLGSKSTYRTSEAVANLDDTARLTMYRLTTEIQLAGYYGYVDDAAFISGIKDSSNALADLTGSSFCGSGWHIDLAHRIEAHNGATALGSSTSPNTTCLDPDNENRAHVDGTDILVIRRASESTVSDTSIEAGNDDATPATDIAGKIFVRADHGSGELYVAGATLPTLGYDASFTENRELITEAFFVSPANTATAGDPDPPMLRRLYLTESGNAAVLTSEEVARNVVDFQVRFGEDSSTPPDGQADRFVEPGDANVAKIVSVQLWLLFRSEKNESDYQSPATYTLADHTYTVPTSDRNLRHMLVTQTVALRNR